MQRVNQLGYIGFGVSNLNAWATSTPKFLGFSELTMTSMPCNVTAWMSTATVLVYQDDADDLGFLGWEVDSKQALHAMAEQLRAAGVEVTPASKEDAESRKVTELVVSKT